MPGEGAPVGDTSALTAIKIGYARVSTDGQGEVSLGSPVWSVTMIRW